MALLNSGCGDDKPDGLAEAAEVINSSESGLVQVAESPGLRVVAKYLTPEYLALADVHSKEDRHCVDSLIVLYQKSLSFNVTVTDSIASSEIVFEVPGQGTGLASGEGGVMDVELPSDLFILNCDGKIWSPVYAVPEVRPGSNGKSWFVVFAIDPQRELQGVEALLLTYKNPHSGSVSRFTYRVTDLLQSKIIASNY